MTKTPDKEPKTYSLNDLAVAIGNDPETASPTRVLASGRGALAEKILEIAFAHGVRVRGDSDLAEILSTVEVDCEIPLEALTAVAEILSYVYRMQDATAPPMDTP